MTTKKIALFIDADNVSAKFGKQIIDALENRGEIFIRRIYGNWEKFSLHGWNDCILNHSLRAVQQPDFATGKNATDMSLTIDAMDVLHDGRAEIFALVSNDSDFTPLAIRLREGGVHVIGLGGAQVSNSFRAACNEFIDLSAPVEVQIVQPPKIDRKLPAKKLPAQMSLFDEDNLVEEETPAPTPPVATNPKVIPITDSNRQGKHDARIQQIHNVLREVTKSHGDAQGFASLGAAGNCLRSKNLGFGVKDFGYGSLNKFVADFPDLYELIQRDTGENFCYRCRTDDRLPKMHEVLRELTESHGDAQGFMSLRVAGNCLRNKKLGFGVRNFGYSTLKKFVADFPDLYEMIQGDTGDGLCFRCRADDKLEQIHSILRETAKAHGDEMGFATLSWAGDAIGKKNLSIKGFGHSTLSKFIAAFPTLYEVKGAGTTISYRCR